jgi:transcriptional regulator with XRE-family HTH domain
MSITTETAWIPSTKTFGARLALVRWRMGWNVKEAALACGLNESNWRGWELDGRLPHKLNEVAGKIAKSTGVSKYWLIEGDPSDYKSPVVDLHKEREKRASSLTRPASRSGNTGPKKRAA